MQWIDTLTVAALCFAIGGLALIVFRKKLGAWLKPEVEHPPLPCPQCGYDVRATLFQCPECGAQLLWGELPGEQRDYDVKARKYERQTSHS